MDAKLPRGKGGVCPLVAGPAWRKWTASWAAVAERGGRGDGPAGEGRPAGPGCAAKKEKEKKIFSPFLFKGLLIVL